MSTHPIEWVTTADMPEDIFFGYAYMTGTCVTFAEGGDDYNEDHGYVDPSWSKHELTEHRNDVKPVAVWRRNEDIEEGETARDSFARWIRQTRDEWISSPQDNADGTIYDESESTDKQGRSWTYALHFSATYHPMRWPNTEYRVALAD